MASQIEVGDRMGKLGLINNFKSLFGSNKTILLPLLTLVFAVGIFLGWSIGYFSQPVEIPTEPNEIKTETEEETTPQKDVVYSKETFIPTNHIATVAVTLGKGEVFEAKMLIWKAKGSEPARPLLPGSLVFYVHDESWRKVIDAGRIEGLYEFSFTAEESGDYTMVFKDDEGYCFIDMLYNASGELRDTSVRR